jgi:hypothetical protein
MKSFSTQTNALRSVMLAGLFAVLTPSPLWAAGTPYGIKGTESPIIQKSDIRTCYAYGKYFVQTTAPTDAVGEDIRVTAAQGKGASCDPKSATLFELRRGLDDNSDAVSFEGLSGNYLFIDNGTGSSGRTLAITDLSDVTKPPYSTAYEGNITLKNGATLSFLRPMGPVKSISKCPNANDALKAMMPDVVLAEQVQLNLSTRKLTKTGIKECVPVQ